MCSTLTIRWLSWQFKTLCKKLKKGKIHLTPVKMTDTVLDCRLPGLLRLVISGPSESGKTSFLFRFILQGEHILQRPFKKVYFFYHNEQPLYDELRAVLGSDIEFLEGNPNDSAVERIVQRQKNSELPFLICMDDFSQSLNKEVATLFTRISHHHKAHLILLIHNIYNRSPFTREITQSANALCLFKNPRDMSIATVLGKQLMPKNSGIFASIYKEATKRPYGYLFVNFHQGAHEDLRYLSNLLIEDWPIRVFIPEI